MMFPVGKPVFVDLNTSFADIAELLKDLTSRRVTGYIRISFPGYEGVLVTHDGSVVQGAEETAAGLTAGPQAVRNLVDKARERGGRLSVFELPASVIDVYAAMLAGDTIHKNLASEFTDLGKMLRRLEADRFSGAVEIALNQDRGTIALFVREGLCIERAWSQPDGEVTRPSVEESLRMVESIGAQLTIYRARREDAAPAAGAPAGPAAAQAVAAPQAPGAPVAAPSAAVAVQASAPADKDAGEAPAGDRGRPVPIEELMHRWGRTLYAAEQVVDAIAGKGTFEIAFRECCVGLADAYPFLDPFAVQFEYIDGKASFYGDPEPDLTVALRRAFDDTVEKLTTKLKRPDLAERIRVRLREVTAAGVAVANPRTGPAAA